MYMLTGFHGFHVTVGVIMLTVILYRIQKGHFTADNHFGNATPSAMVATNQPMICLR
jgi:heme/copper-type cytochrome/quinol oxidase subunit 3